LRGNGEAEGAGEWFGNELAVAGADVRAVGVRRGCDGLFWGLGWLWGLCLAERGAGVEGAVLAEYAGL